MLLYQKMEFKAKLAAKKFVFTNHHGEKFQFTLSAEGVNYYIRTYQYEWIDAEEMRIFLEYVRNNHPSYFNYAARQ